MSPTPDRNVDFPSLVVGALVACAGGLFLVEPIVDPFVIFETTIRPIALSAIVLTAGFGLGAVLYRRRNHRSIALAHAIGALGFASLAGAMAVGSQPLLFGGVVVLVGGSAFLVAQVSRDG